MLRNAGAPVFDVFLCDEVEISGFGISLPRAFESYGNYSPEAIAKISTNIKSTDRTETQLGSSSGGAVCDPKN
ncbi:hypothetical protein ATY78_09480 [Rhizobium sp. R635]|nr:hypothetical protein ATY78_09480 [Rhizobium sp. R635]